MIKYRVQEPVISNLFPAATKYEPSLVKLMALTLKDILLLATLQPFLQSQTFTTMSCSVPTWTKHRSYKAGR